MKNDKFLLNIVAFYSYFCSNIHCGYSKAILKIFNIYSRIMKTYPYNLYPLAPHFYIVKFGFTGVNNLFSSPEPSGSQGANAPASVNVVVVVVVHNVQTSSTLNPLGQSKTDFLWSLLGKGKRKFI